MTRRSVIVLKRPAHTVVECMQSFPRNRDRHISLLGIVLVVAAAIPWVFAQAAERAPASSFYAPRFARIPSVADMSELGRALFADRSLSASGRVACATCHDPRFAYGPPDRRVVAVAGANMKRAGIRAVPSLRYLQTVPPFAEHRFDESVDESVDQGPSGGLMWDGRADTRHDQARLPLLSPFEMANATPTDVVARARVGPFAARLRSVFGDTVFDDDSRAFDAIVLALEVFQQSAADFYPYSSRYDEWLRGRAVLNPIELRGLDLFNDPRKGNCASCHPSQMRHGAFPQFTDFGYAALGVPRNRRIPADADAAFHDLGLCGPQRKDLAGRAELCGLFRVPTLRNVAARAVYFHNGALHRLSDVVAFYAECDTRPARWYARVGGRSESFDDLPLAYRVNVNRDPPFGRKAGERPALATDEISAIAAFLRTLSDADVRAR